MYVSARFVAVFKSWLFSIVVAIAVLAPSGASADDRFHHHRLIDRIVVFGDSLSDSGNAFALNGGVFVAPPDYGMAGVDPVTGIPEVIPLIPAAPYKSERFTNANRTWVELIAGAAGLGAYTKPAFAGSDGRASNYAVGGARANAVGPAPHLSQQVGFFLLGSGGSDLSSALVVIEIGGNDIRDAVLAVVQSQNPMAGIPIVQGAADLVRHNIQLLYGAGARKFLVWNAPDLGSTPAFQRLNDLVPQLGAINIAGIATFHSVAYNAFLAGHLQDLAANLEGIDIVPFNVFEKLGEIQEHPRRFGLRDATTACIEPNVPPLFASSPPFRCKHPEQHFSWDGIHPTRAGHRIIAFLAAKELLVELVLDD
jgi:phospholipase/lecithinase/hemolysin